jgi:putative hydrolase of the HAD superfamily
VDISEKQIKNIIFDLGGVIINIDYNLLVQSFSKIGMPHFEEYFSQKNQREFFDEYEKGTISSVDFRAKLKEHCPPDTDDSAIDKAWNSMIMDIPKERLDLLMKVKKRYRTFLLSNTNEIHMKFIYGYLKDTFQQNNFSNYFEKVYLSYEMGMRKPDPEIFERVLAENNLNPKETLFIDDSIQHIKSAEKLRLQAYLLDVKKESINDLVML